jgi:hypothetical protein
LVAFSELLLGGQNITDIYYIYMGLTNLQDAAPRITSVKFICSAKRGDLSVVIKDLQKIDFTTSGALEPSLTGHQSWQKRSHSVSFITQFLRRGMQLSK